MKISKKYLFDKIEEFGKSIAALESNNYMSNKRQQELLERSFLKQHAISHLRSLRTHQELYDELMEENETISKRLDVLLKHLKLEEFTEPGIPTEDKIRPIKEEEDG